MKDTTKAAIAGIVLGCMSAVALVAGTAAVAEVADTVAENETAITETLTAIVNFLPFPWNVIGGAALTAGGALFAWYKTKKKKD